MVYLIYHNSKQMQEEMLEYLIKKQLILDHGFQAASMTVLRIILRHQTGGIFKVKLKGEKYGGTYKVKVNSKSGRVTWEKIKPHEPEII
jgi:hypothetical protein